MGEIMKHIKTLKELNKKETTQYKTQNIFVDFVNTEHEKGLERAEIYQIWSYSTIIAYYNKTTNKVVFTSKKYTRTTGKQKNNIINENGLEKQEINKTFTNWGTYSDLQEIKAFLI